MPENVHAHNQSTASTSTRRITRQTPGAERRHSPLSPSHPFMPWDPARSPTSRPYYTADAVNRESATEPPDTRGTGPAAMFATAEWLRTAFSDLTWDIHDIAHDDDLVVVHATMSGRQTGPFVAYLPDATVAAVFPPRGRSVRDHPESLVPDEETAESPSTGPTATTSAWVNNSAGLPRPPATSCACCSPPVGLADDRHRSLQPPRPSAPLEILGRRPELPGDIRANPTGRWQARAAFTTASGGFFSEPLAAVLHQQFNYRRQRGMDGSIGRQCTRHLASALACAAWPDVTASRGRSRTTMSHYLIASVPIHATRCHQLLAVAAALVMNVGHQQSRFLTGARFAPTPVGRPNREYLRSAAEGSRATHRARLHGPLVHDGRPAGIAGLRYEPSAPRPSWHHEQPRPVRRPDRAARVLARQPIAADPVWTPPEVRSDGSWPSPTPARTHDPDRRRGGGPQPLTLSSPAVPPFGDTGLQRPGPMLTSARPRNTLLPTSGRDQVVFAPVPAQPRRGLHRTRPAWPRQPTLLESSGTGVSTTPTRSSSSSVPDFRVPPSPTIRRSAPLRPDRSPGRLETDLPVPGGPTSHYRPPGRAGDFKERIANNDLTELVHVPTVGTALADKNVLVVVASRRMATGRDAGCPARQRPRRSSSSPHDALFPPTWTR